MVGVGTGFLVQIGVKTLALAAPRKAISQKMTECTSAILARLRLVIMANSGIRAPPSGHVRGCFGRAPNGQQNRELRPFPNGATYLDRALMFLNDPPRQ